MLIQNFVIQTHFLSQLDNRPRSLAQIMVKSAQLLLHFII